MSVENCIDNVEFELKIVNQKLRDDPRLLPYYSTDLSAGIDLKALESFSLYPNETYELKTGFALWIKDPSYAALIIPRSGLGSKCGIVIANLVGLIDADYQGEIIAVLWNRSSTEITFSKGDRVAQMFFPRIGRPSFEIVDDFSFETKRGTGGFGHTGV